MADNNSMFSTDSSGDEGVVNKKTVADETIPYNDVNDRSIKELSNDGDRINSSLESVVVPLAFPGAVPTVKKPRKKKLHRRREI